MSVTEFKQAGLDKLTPEQLTVLNRWFANTLQKVFTSLDSQSSTGSVIESYIDGDFEGWSGETIFKLDNGQIWQQSSYAYTYHYSYHPKVLIYKSGSGYKMKIDGVDDAINVKRLK